jgi:hypothetical protein
MKLQTPFPRLSLSISHAATEPSQDSVAAATLVARRFTTIHDPLPSFASR